MLRFENNFAFDHCSTMLIEILPQYSTKFSRIIDRS